VLQIALGCGRESVTVSALLFKVDTTVTLSQRALTVTQLATVTDCRKKGGYLRAPLIRLAFIRVLTRKIVARQCELVKLG